MCQDCYADDDYSEELDDSHYDDDGDDRYDEYKDDLAMGYINPDGSQREPDPAPDDPWYYRPSLLQRVRWRIRDWRRRLKRRPDRYDDEPPF